VEKGENEKKKETMHEEKERPPLGNGDLKEFGVLLKMNWGAYLRARALHRCLK